MAQAHYQRLYLIKYKNYYDRVATTDIAEHIFDKATLVETVSDYNFNENDGVNTEIVINRTLSHAANYLIVQNQDDEEYVSQWYIMDCKRNLKGQETLLLRRDVLHDYMADWMMAKSFVEKGTVADTNDAIFNSEGISYNQIKVGEELLTDEYKCQWLVGYYDKKSRSEIVGTDLTINPDADIVVSSLANWEFNPIVGNETGAFLYEIKNIKIATSVMPRDSTLLPIGSACVQWEFDANKNTLERTNAYPYQSFYNRMRYVWKNNEATKSATLANYIKEKNNIIETIRKSRGKIVENGILTEEQSRKAQSLHGKILKAGSNYYRINVTFSVVEREFNFVEGADDTQAIDKVFADAWTQKENIFDCYYKISGRVVELSLSPYESTAEKYSYDIGTEAANYSTDAEYGVFAIPYTDEDIGREYCNKEVAMMVANHMLQNYDLAVYDIQLLPFAPDGIRADDTDSKAVSHISTSAGTVAPIFHIQNINTTKIIQFKKSIDNYKIENETEFCRLCSPNYQSVYEFTPAKNDGIKYFTVDMTLKPYSPYIHVRPNTARLYGQDYGDATGLICAGDFSLTRVTDKWAEYEMQNKNYEKQFDRQIENLEVQQNVQRAQEPWSVVAGALQAGTSGALAGSVGGPIGTAVGAVAGAGASLVAGIADILLNEKLRNEAIDFSKDNFQMQMQNIRALPRTLNKVDAFNANNKKFVFLETYSATDEEKKALAWKIVMEGMTINRIGRFYDYICGFKYGDIESLDLDFKIYPFVRGKIIKFNDDFVGDYHIAKAIAEEVAKGVYVFWE